MSRLSAPRSSMKLASSVTLSASTPRCSTTIFFTRSAVSLILLPSLAWGLDYLNALERPLRAGKPSDHSHAAIDVQRLAGDVPRLLARQIHDRGTDVLSAAEIARRDAREQRLL